MWGQKYELGDLTRAGPRLVQCSDREVGSGAFSGGLSKCWTQLFQCRDLDVGSGVFPVA